MGGWISLQCGATSPVRWERGICVGDGCVGVVPGATARPCLVGGVLDVPVHLHRRDGELDVRTITWLLLFDGGKIGSGGSGAVSCKGGEVFQLEYTPLLIDQQ